MANNDGGGEDFSDAANSIMDSFSQLQESMQDYADQLSQMQNNAGDTLFDSDFMQSLEESLFILAENSSIHIDKQEELIGSIENLERKMEELGKKLESAEIATGGGGGSTSINYDRLQKSVSEGVSAGMEGIEMSGGGDKIAELSSRLQTWLDLTSGDLPGEDSAVTSAELAEMMSGGGNPAPRIAMEALKAADIDPEEIQRTELAEGQGQLSQMLAGGDLESAFPEFLENVNTDLSVFREKVKLTSEDLQEMDANVEDLTESGRQFTEIPLAKFLSGELKEGTEAFEEASNKLFKNFQEFIGEESTDVLEKLQNVSEESRKKLENITGEDMTTFEQKMFGMEPFFEQTQKFSDDVIEKLMNVQSTVSKLNDKGVEDADKMGQAVSESVQGMIDEFESMKEENLGINEIRNKLLDAADEQREKQEDLREGNSVFAGQQDRVLQAMVEQLQNIEETKQKAKLLSEIYESHFEELARMNEMWDNLKSTVSKVWTILKNPRTWLWVGIGAAASAASSLASYFLSIDQTMQELAENTGLLSRNLREVRQRSMSIHGEMLATGAAFSDIVNAAGVMRSELGGTENAVRRLGYDSAAALQQSIVRTAQGFNVSNSAAAELLNTMNAITGATGKQLERGMRFVQELSAINEVAPQQIMKDAAEAAGELAKFGGLTADEIATAAVEARKMGSNLSDVLNIAKGFREDITGSVQQLQQAALMAGQPIDTQGLIEASFQSPQKFTNRLRKEIGKLNLNFENLAPYRIQQIAEGFGISARKLREMNRAAKQAKMRFKDLGERGKSAAQRMSAVGNKVKSSQTTWNQLKNTISGLATLLLNTFAGPIFRIVNPVLKSFAEYLGDALEGLGDLSQASFSDVFDAVTSSMKKTQQELSGTKAKTASMGHAFIKLIKKTYVGAKRAWPVLKAIGTAIYQIGTAIGYIIEPLNELGAWFGRMKSNMNESEATFWTYVSVLGSLAGAIYGLKYAIGSLGSSTSIMKSAAMQLAAIGGALYLASEAVQNFAELGWGEVIRGMVGFAGAALTMVLTLKYLGKVAMSSGAQMAAAAGLLLTFAGSMWVLGDAMQKFADAGWEGAKIMGAVATGLVVLGGALAFVLSSGVGAAAAAGAAGLFGAFAVSLWIVSDAMQGFAAAWQGFAAAWQGFAKALHSILDVVNRIQKLENLSSLVPKIKKLAEALSNMPGTGFGDILAGIVGTGAGAQLTKMVELARSANNFRIVAKSMERVASSLERIAAAEVSEELQKIKDISYNKRRGREALSSQKNQVSSPTVDTVRTGMGYSARVLGQSNQEGNTTTTTKGGGKKPDSIREILKDIRNTENALLSSLRKGDIRVYMDGEDVTDTVYKHSTRRNQSG